MNICEFFTKYCAHKVDFDGYYGAQCVDLFRQYCKDVLGIPHTGTVGGAKELYLNYDNLPLERQFFYRLNPSVYKLGDVVVWDGTYGHVAIVVSSEGENLLVFEQDGFTQDGAKFSLRSRKNILGVLRCKN